MNYNQIAILFLQGFLIAFVILLLFRLRKKLGIGVLFACLGLFQFVQVFLSSTVYVSIADNFLVSPGSSVLFPATLFALLIIYIKEDASETKKIIYALFIVNIVLTVLLRTFGWHFNETSIDNPLNVSTDLFNVSSWVLLVGTIALVLDSLLIIVLFEFIARKVRFLFWQICITMLLVVSFDTLFFHTIAFWGSENHHGGYVLMGLISKGVFTFFYSILFYVYLRYFDLTDKELVYIKIKDVFKPLSYKQKFDSALHVIKKAKEEREVELSVANKEKEKRIAELELSKQKLEITLALLEKRKFSMDEASKIAKIAYHEYDIASDTFIWSEYMYHIFGLDLKKPIPPRIELFALFNDVSQKRMIKATQDLDLKGISYDIELSLTNFKNKLIWIRNVTQPVYNQQYEVVGRKGVTLDITAAKKAQLQLELSKQKIETTLELLEKRDFSMNEASKIAKIGYLEDDIASKTRIWSENLYHIFGLDLKDKIPSGEELLALLDEESQQKSVQAGLKLDNEGVSFDIEVRMINLRKEALWLRTVVHPVYNDQKEVVGRRGVVQDITSFKKGQQELELSKQKIEAALEAVKENEYSLKEAGRMAKIGYWKYDKLTDTIFWSDAIHEIYRSDVTTGVPEIDAILSVFSEESSKKLIDATIILADKGIPFDIDLEMTNFKNEKRWIRNIGEPIYNDKNEIIGRRGVSQDITALKLSEKKLNHQHEKLQDLNSALNEAQRLSHVGNWQWNMTKDTAEWSDEMYRIYGVTKENFYPSNENVSKTILPEDLHKVNEGVSSLLVDKMFVPFEFRIKRPSGEIRHVYIMALKKDSQESIFGVTKDITEQKIIEEKNLLITEQYKNLFNNSSASIWDEDLSFLIVQIDELRKLKIPNIKVYLEQHPKVLFSLLDKIKVNKVNKSTLRLFRANSYQEFFENIQYVFGSGSSKVFAKFIQSIWKKEKSFSSEVNYKTIKGEEFTAILSIPIPQTEAEQKRVPVSSQSIQNIKEAELAKRVSITKLKEAQKLAKIGSWVLTPSTQEVEWSEEAFHVFGFDPKKGVPDFEIQTDIIHPDDKEFVFETISQMKSFDIEHRIIQLDGVEKWIRSICKPIFGGDGEVINLTGTCQDITQQKRAKEKIEKVDEMYRILTDNSNDLICLQESDGTFKYISPSVKSLLGYEQSEFLGKKIFSVVYPDDIEPLKEAMKKMISSGLVNDAFAFRIRHKEGHFIWIEFLSSPVYKDKEISYFVTSARNITQWVLAKQEIQEYQTALQKMTTEITLIEEKQKKEIASNIHDHLSQSLVISNMRINQLKKNKALKLIHEDLSFIGKHISEALENSRKITYELSPPVLYQLGIIDALNWLFEEVEATHKIECRVMSTVNNIKLSEVKSILLYRCIQELMKNVVKYAIASLVTLEISKKELGIYIILKDNGVGFNTSVLNNYQNQSGSGFGLFAVQERIKNIQGEFKITSKINAGTSIHIFIPLSI